MSATRWSAVLGALVLASAGALYAAEKGEGSDIEFGGPGTGQGTFDRLADMAFDAAGTLYVLDGGDSGKKDPALAGNFLVQKFDGAGKFLSQFSLKDEKLGTTNEPVRLAVDARRHVFVTRPRAGLVREYGPDGVLVKDYPVAGAYAVCVRQTAGKEQIVVIARPGKRQEEPAAEAQVIDAAGGAVGSIKLGRPMTHVEKVTADAAGNLYAIADTNQLYKFDPAGKCLEVIGGGTKLRLEDGSELLHTVAVDAKGCIYSVTPGNPGWLTRFDPDLRTMTRRKGQFYWFDAWGAHSGYTPLAISPDGRLWVGTTGKNDGKERHHYRPCILRLQANYLDPATGKVTVESTRLLGLNLAVEVKLPYNVAYELKPIAADFIVKAGARRVPQIDVSWHVYDAFKQEAAKGAFSLALKDGEESRQAVSFLPPRFGWYSVQFQVAGQGERLTGLAAHVGVTPAFPGMPSLAEGEAKGGWEDAARQAFAGLMLMRVHPNPKNLDQVEKTIEAAARYGCTLIAQFQDKEHCEPEFVREVVTRFKGRVKYWEIVNEPNFSFKPAEYAAVVKELYPIIKGIDPAASVMAPTVCGIQMPWHEEFYKATGKNCFDIVSIHDYEGHESIDPFHWVWKFGELRKLMAAGGDGAKPIWQTERAIGGVRGKVFLGTCQAVRVTLHEDLLAALGIPSEHNLHYYLNEGGYSGVPTFLWSSAGPHPGALATRTRWAMTQGRTPAGTLDLGPTGSKMFLGLRYTGDDGTVLILRNLGTIASPLELAVKGGDRVDLVDAFGNVQTVQARDGRVTVTVSPLPLYVRVAKGTEVTVPRLDFGPNLAAKAKFTYSATVSKGDAAILNDGRMQTVHAGNPDGGTDGKNIWTGDLPTLPQTLEMAFDRPETIGAVIVFGVRADNQFCALLDYDLEYHDGKAWVTLQKVRTPQPESDVVNTPLCKAISYDQDTNFFASTFRPVTAERLRLVVLRTTYGFYADDAARKAASSEMAPKLMLREIEVYGPPGAASR